MAEKRPARMKSCAGGGGTGRRRIAFGGCVLLAGALVGLAAYRYGDAPGFTPPPHVPAPSPVITLGAVGLVCYTMFFLVCEAALLVLAVINIQDEKMHNKYKSLMLLVLYVFTFRYRRVLPAKFFAEAGMEATRAPAAGDGSRKAGKHHHKRRETAMNSEPSSPPSPQPVTDEEIRVAFTALLARMATALGDNDTATGERGTNNERSASGS